MLIIASTCTALAVALAVLVWKFESNYRVVLSPIILLLFYFLVRILPGYVYAVEVKQASGYLPYLVFMLALLAMIFGWLLTIPVFGTAVDRLRQNSSAELTEDSVLTQVWIGLVLIVLLGLGYFLYRGTPPALVPLITLLTGGDWIDLVQGVSDARKELTKSHLFGGAYRGQGAIREVIFVGGALVGCYFFARFLRKRTLARAVVFLAVALVLYGLVSGDGTRGPFLLVFISIIATATYVKRLPLWRMGAIIIGFIALGILLGSYTPKMHSIIMSDGVQGAIFAFLERVAVGNSVNDVYAMEAFADGRLTTGYGYWFYRDLISAFPGIAGGKPLAYYLYLATSPGSSATTYLTGTYVMSSYGDFGLLGVMVSFLLVGALAAFGGMAISLMPRTELGAAASGALAMLFGQLYVAGPIGVFVQVALFTALLMPAWLLYLFIRPHSEGN